MKNDAFEYAKRIADELKNLYYNEPDEDNEDEAETLADYLADALDVEYTLNSCRECIGVRVYVTLGGPTCWIDTRWNTVECVWGGEDRATVYIDSDISDYINELFPVEV